MNNIELLTDEEVSKIFKVEKSTVTGWCSRNKIPDGIVFKIGNGKKATKRFIKSRLEEWILNGGLQKV